MKCQNSHGPYPWIRSPTSQNIVDESCLPTLSLRRRKENSDSFPGFIPPTCCRGHPVRRILYHHESLVTRGGAPLGRNAPPPLNALALTHSHTIVGPDPIHLRTRNAIFKDILMHRTGSKDRRKTKACAGGTMISNSVQGMTRRRKNRSLEG